MMLLNESSGAPAEVTLEQVIEAGKFEGMAEIPEALYFAALKYTSNSYLNESEQSPAHGQASRLFREPTAAQLFGRLFHAACLEAERFEKTYVAEPRAEDFPGVLDSLEDLKAHCVKLSLPVSGTKAALKTRIREKDPSARFMDEVIDAVLAGKEPLKQEVMDQIRFMRDAVFKHSSARAALTEGKAEQSAFWQDRETGVMMKARFDYTHTERGVITDLKTTEDASPEGFRKSVADWKYHRQSALYLDGFNAIHKTDTNLFLHVACEKKAPYAVGVYVLDDASVDLGRLQYRALLAREAACQKTGTYPAYSEDIQSMSLPHWAFNQEIS